MRTNVRYIRVYHYRRLRHAGCMRMVRPRIARGLFAIHFGTHIAISLVFLRL
ncbi:hypothetical protein BIFADO_00296 [Bifidobacterium adolescentis L2-32]|uniref:Uncharacterized protein n=1 Tax=Bifidobacterium adolescentis L2-32 TaxID=411481 RepID=A7A3A7_BIFAD|nr:hypothetical protein BIFADO_00296 [Bifidobacterium adolescentis L2-32]